MPDTTKEKEVKEAVKEPVKETKKVETPVQDMSLPVLMANITQRIMSALAGDSIPARQQAIDTCRRDLRMWYESQPTENRMDIAKASKKALEQFKMISEAMYQELVTISAQDM